MRYTSFFLGGLFLLSGLAIGQGRIGEVHESGNKPVIEKVSVQKQKKLQVGHPASELDAVILKSDSKLQLSGKGQVKEGNVLRQKPAAQRVLRLESVRPSKASPDKAVVTLKIDLGENGYDQSGYQMYFDFDANTYGVFFPTVTDLRTWVESGVIPADTLAQFENVIPQNASGDPADRLWLGNGEESSIELNPGTYDYLIANLLDYSQDGMGTWVNMAQGDGFEGGDDFFFAAGVEYVFSVTVIEGEWGAWESVQLSLAAPVDMALTAIHAPQTGEDLGSEEVRISLKNEGMEPISIFKVFYQVDEQSEVEEPLSLSEPLEPGDSIEYAFVTKADFSAGGWHTLTARVDAENDALSTNNGLEMRVFNALPLSVPVSWGFETEERFKEWRVIDANQDAYSWGWGNPGIQLYNGEESENNDWIISQSPVFLSKGEAYMHFMYKSSPYALESLEVLCGTSPDTGSMNRLLLLEDVLTTAETFQSVNFDVPEDGNYYFAFRSCSKAGYMLDIDDINVNTGTFVGTPDLSLSAIEMPASVCGLGDAEPVVISLYNSGTADIQQFELTYTVNGKDSASRVFDDTVLMGRTRDFALYLDFSQEDTYEVSVTGEVLEADGGNLESDTTLDDNRISGKVTHFSPATLPYHTDMSVEEDRVQWYIEEDAWYYDGYYDFAMNARSVGTIVSRCISMEEGKSYRIGYHLRAGMVLFDAYFDSYTILIGISGTARNTWDTLVSYMDVYTNEVYGLEEIVFECPESASYSLAFVAETDPWNLSLKDFSVEEVFDHDVRVTGVRSSYLGISTPAHFAAFPAFNVDVENRGLNDEASVTVSLLHDGKSLGESGSVSVPVDSVRTAFVQGRMAQPSVGDMLSLELSASLGAEDQNADNNAMVFAFNVTDSVFAFDSIRENPVDGLGVEGYVMGNVFSIPVADTLTGVSVSWYDLTVMGLMFDYPESFPVVLEIYPVDLQAGTVGAPIVEQEYERFLAGGFRDIAISDLYLDAGSYFIGLRQTGEELMGIGYDQNPQGLFYVVDNGVALPMTGNGNLGIRAIFGHDAQLSTRDVAVTEITKPAMDEGLFTANETIEFIVKNWGTETVSAPVSLQVSGQLTGTATVELAPYASDTVSFVADLSKVGELYEIAAFSNLDGDENRANDTCYRYVLSQEALDPYVMDFENCPDFAEDHFNPAWTSVDGDGQRIGGFANYSFPTEMSPRGFIAFNPSETQPSMMSDFGSIIAPHGGDRYGASLFLYSGGAVNDWLISPKLKLPTTGCKMEFYVKSLQQTQTGGLEQYKVLYSETDVELGSFMAIGDVREAPATDWEKVEVDLTEIAGKEGKEIYLAIQCITADGAMFMIDDISITKPTANEGMTDVASTLSLYPNPATDVLTIASYAGSIRQVAIMNLSGAEIYCSSASLDTPEFRYHVSGLASGMYFARVVTENGTALLKFVVR